MPATEWGYAGAFECLVWLIDSNGYPFGTLATPDSPTQATEYHAHRTLSLVSAQLPVPERALAEFFGGQTYLGSIDLGVSGLGEGSIEFSRADETLISMITGATLDEATITDWSQFTFNEMNPNLPAVGFLISTRIRLKNGALSYAHIVMPNCQLRPPAAALQQGDGQNPNNLTFGIVPAKATRSVDGYPFSSMALNAYNDELLTYIIRYNSRFQLTTYVKDATDASAGGSFVMGYRPTSSATGSPNSFTVNGAALTPTSVTPATGVVAFGIAGAAGDIIEALLPTDYVAI